MRGKIRKLIADNPRAMDAAYAMALSGAVLISTQQATGVSSGP